MRGIGKAESNFSQDFYNRQCHIIGIGIDKYKYKDWPILNNCEKDVERFISTVCSSFKTFEDSTDYVTRLYNEDANKLLIGDTIKGKLRELKNHQNLIIYFAGHGKDHEKEEVSYLAPFDAKSDYVNLDNSRLISYQDIFKWISNTNALHIVLILDCCHAGRIMNAKRSSPDRFEKIENFEQYINLNLGYADFQSQMKEKSVWVITSGSDNDKVFDGDELGSPFSQALNKVLTGSVKFNKPLSVAYLGSVLKNHFPAKHKYKPDFKRLSELLDYKSNKGEFVFEPKPQKVVNSESTTSKTPNESFTNGYKERPIDESSSKNQRRPNNPSNTEESSIGEIFTNRIPLYPQISASPTAYSNTGNKPSKSHLKYWAGLFFIVIPLLLLYKTKRDKNNERPEPNVEPTIVLPPSSGIGGGVDTFVPVKDAPPSKLTIDPPTVNSPQDRIITPKGGIITDGMDKPTSKGDKDIPSHSIGSKGIDQDKEGNGAHSEDYNVIDNSKPYNEDNNLNIKPNLVFLGSFENKVNAVAMLERLKKIGYQDAEIIMKENMPYAVVVTGFYQYKSSAKAEVKAIRKKGFKVYHAKADLTKIYRQKE